MEFKSCLWDSKKEFLSLLEIPRKDVHVFKAPAQGLILEKINYA